jgi:hypothetical protein
LLHDAVAHGRDAQWPFLAAAGFIDPYAAHRLRFVAVLARAGVR